MRLTLEHMSGGGVRHIYTAEMASNRDPAVFVDEFTQQCLNFLGLQGARTIEVLYDDVEDTGRIR